MVQPYYLNIYRDGRTECQPINGFLQCCWKNKTNWIITATIKGSNQIDKYGKYLLLLLIVNAERRSFIENNNNFMSSSDSEKFDAFGRIKLKIDLHLALIIDRLRQKCCYQMVINFGLFIFVHSCFVEVIVIFLSSSLSWFAFIFFCVELTCQL